MARIVPTVFFALIGTWLWISGDEGWLALVSILLVLISIASQMHFAARYWRLSMGDT
jgi:hypothetical protein